MIFVENELLNAYGAIADRCRIRQYNFVSLIVFHHGKLKGEKEKAKGRERNSFNKYTSKSK